ncbi:MAG: DUF4962 domain-containing protein [Anaerolineae bacterium]|nr:DUF4962 domain-containing protein [Anaerolineae bacterium]
MTILRRALLAGLAMALLVTPLAGLAVPLPESSVRAQDDGVPLPVAEPGAHPRLLITSAYIEDTLIPRMEDTTPAWVAFASYLESSGPDEDAALHPGLALRSLALAWLVTGDEGYAQSARDVMIGLVTLVDSDPAMNGGALSEAFIDHVAVLALGYDWLYGGLTDTDRAALVDVLWRAAKRLRNPAADVDNIIWLDGELRAFDHGAVHWLWALTAVGLALWGDYEDAPALVDFCRETLAADIIPALDIQTGGAWAEGPMHGFAATYAVVQTALVWWTAAGENFFTGSLWWYDRLAYDLFLYYPTPTTTGNRGGAAIYDYPAIIGDSARFSTAAAYGRAGDLMLRAVFSGTEHGDWMDWFLRQPPDGLPPWLAVEEFLWRDPLATGSPPSDLTWYAPYTGHVFLRSGWTGDGGALDAGATAITFNAGDRLAEAQYYDQGSFTLFHNGHDLIVRSGVYSGGTSDHDANYAARTIAANTVLVCDLAENFDGIRANDDRDIWLNDCGQRSTSPYPASALNVGYLYTNWRAYDTGSLLRYGDRDGITYLRADLTGAYNSTVYTTPENRDKVSLVWRELVYIRPSTVIVTDRVITTYPSYTPMQVFHFQTEPTPSGLFFGSLVDHSALYMQNLLPNSRVTVIGGYQVGGQIVDQSGGGPIGNEFENQPYGTFRLEIAPGQLNLDNWFLVAFIAQNADQPPPSEGMLVLGEGVRGTVRGSWQVMFDDQPGSGADVTDASFQIAPGVESVLITGLVPGAAYTVETDGREAQTLTADDAGLIVITGALPGTARVALAAEEKVPS